VLIAPIGKLLDKRLALHLELLEKLDYTFDDTLSKPRTSAPPIAEGYLYV